ncbi:MAG: hypothetical protein AAGA56_27325 [Myxococcota bacterium]
MEVVAELDNSDAMRSANRCIASPGVNEDGQCPTAVRFKNVYRFRGSRLNESATETRNQEIKRKKGFEYAEMCCYDVFSERSRPVRGRPYASVSGELVVADVESHPEIAPNRYRAHAARLPPEVRRRLASQWLHDARMEHASVAAFGRLGLQLMAHGAPLDLVARCHRAAGDEVRHAALCLEVASGLSESSFALGPLAWQLTETPTLAALIEESLRDGCLGEGAAALVAEEAAAACEVDGLQDALGRLAEEEREHAALAWRVVSWALHRDPETTRAVLQAWVEREAAELESPLAEPVAEHEVAAWGVVSPARERWLRQRCLAEVVLPAAQRLLTV